MATAFKNKIENQLGTSPTQLIATQPASRITVIGMSLCNLLPQLVKVSVTLTDSPSTTGYYVKDVQIPPNQSLRIVNGGEKLIMAENSSLSAFADQAAAVDVIISYVEIV